MATPSNTTKSKPDNLTRTKSLGRKPKPPSSSEDGSDQKPEKPIPNYLKPTISSRSDPVKFVKKNNPSLDDNQKLLRRRSFDRPPSTSASPRIHKSLNVSPSRSRDKPTVPREKPVTAQRSSSFHGSRNVPKGGTTSTVKSLPVAPKKSVLGSSSKTSKIKKEDSGSKKGSDKEIALDSASVTSAQEDHHEEILKDESDHGKAVEHVEESKDDNENKEVHVEAVQADESGKEDNESSGPTPVTSPVGKDCNVVNKELEEKMINEDKTEVEEKIEETKEQEKKGEEEEEVEKKTDENETPEKVEEPESVEETKEEKEEENEVKEEEKIEVKEEENEKVKEEEVKQEEKEEEVKQEEKEEEKVKEEEKEEEKEKEKEKVKEEETAEEKKKEIVRGQKGSPSAYNDVIASKIQENPRKNKVLALAGAFQTVIDYETAASK